MRRCVSKGLKLQIVSRQKNRCASCTSLLEATFEVDHRDPLWHGGSNHPRNLQALCPNCHARKSKVEQQSIPRMTRYHNTKRCPLCNDYISTFFIHRCSLFNIVDPSLFTLHRVQYEPCNKQSQKTIIFSKDFLFDTSVSAAEL